MPLFRYFITVGTALTALLLVVNLLLEPSDPTPQRAYTVAETNPSSPGVAGPVNRHTVGVTRTLPSAPDPYALPPRATAQNEQADPIAGNSADPASRTNETHRKSARETKSRRKSAQARARNPDVDDPWRYVRQPAYSPPAYSASAYSDTRYDSRAGLRPRWSSSSQGTLGPH